MAKATATHLTVPKIIEVGNYLATVCTPAPHDNSLCVYKEGFDDDRVAAVLGIRSSQVSGVRLKTLGKLHHNKSTTEEAMLMLLRDLEAKVAQLQTWASARPVSPFHPDP